MFINEIIPNNKYERRIFLLTPFPNQEVRAYDWMDLVLTNRPVLRALHF